MIKKLTIQGCEGSFHEEAARKFFGKDISLIYCNTFNEVAKTVKSEKKVDGGVMAIENSIAGSILPNYTLLQENNLKITGEVYLQIKHHLLVNQNVNLEDIHEVRSHPMAILQCSKFLGEHSWKIVKTGNTSISARALYRYKSKRIAAIASKSAAELYKLKIIVPNIHSQKNNYTRFLILQKENSFIKNADKASIYFSVNHAKGNLAKVLNKIAEEDINLDKIQSIPIPGSNFNYSFYVDMEFKKIDCFYKTMKKLKPLTNHLTIYGIYKNGKV